MMETKRLRLRPFLMSDAEAVYAYASLLEVGNAAGWKPHASIEETRRIIEAVFMNPEADTTFAIVDKYTNHVIGSIGYRSDPHRMYAGCASIGYVLHPNYWGNGLMREAVAMILDHIFTATYYDIVAVDHAIENIRSKRVIEKCGFQYEGTLRKCTLQLWNGEIKDHCFYSMTKEEYLKQKGKEND